MSSTQATEQQTKRSRNPADYAWIRMTVVALTMVIAPLAAQWILSLGAWMMFAYLAFMVILILALVMQPRMVGGFDRPPKRGEYLFHAIVLTIDAVVALFPFVFIFMDESTAPRGFYYEYHGGLALVGVLFTVLILGMAAKESLEFFFSYHKDRQREAAYEAKEQQRRQRQEAFMQRLDQQYGEPSAVIRLEQPGHYYADDEQNYRQCIYFFDQAKHVVIKGVDYAYDQVMECMMLGDSYRDPDTVIAHTTTDTGDMIARAALGKAVFGNAGAIIGGATARTTTQYETIRGGLHVNYTVFVTLRNKSGKTVERQFQFTDTSTAIELNERFLKVIKGKKGTQY